MIFDARLGYVFDGGVRVSLLKVVEEKTWRGGID